MPGPENSGRRDMVQLLLLARGYYVHSFHNDSSVAWLLFPDDYCLLHVAVIIHSAPNNNIVNSTLLKNAEAKNYATRAWSR